MFIVKHIIKEGLMINFLKKLFSIKKRSYATASIEKELDTVYFTKRT